MLIHVFSVVHLSFCKEVIVPESTDKLSEVSFTSDLILVPTEKPHCEIKTLTFSSKRAPPLEEFPSTALFQNAIEMTATRGQRSLGCGDRDILRMGLLET